MRSILPCLLLISCSFGSWALPATGDPALPAPEEPAIGQPTPNQYIVVLKSSISREKIDTHKKKVSSELSKHRSDTGGGIQREFRINSFNAYVGTFDDSTVDTIKNSPEVASVEQDAIVTAAGYGYGYDYGDKRCRKGKKKTPRGLVTQKNVPSWGLARISQTCKPIDFTKYFFDKSAGKGATAYVIDTGVRLTHTTFGGRASFGATFTNDGPDDGNGHGTHVAGTIAGKEYGVAKKARIIAVKVLDTSGNGLISQLIAGIEWAALDAITAGRSRRSVANLSVGGPHSPAVNAAVKAAVDSGLTVVVAADNQGVDANTRSPASERSAITVGATDGNDVRASFSNFGPVVDIFAPGVDITSAGNMDDTASRVLSGTSMAAPHVAGVACYLIAKDGVRGPRQIANRILKLADLGGGVVTGPGPGTTTRLLYNGAN